MNKTSTAVKSVFIYTFFAKFITIASSIVLARLLFPEDFGYLVMVMIFTGFISIVVDVGFEYYYIVKVDINADILVKESVLNTIFIFRVIFNICLFILQFLGSYLVESYFEYPIIGEMLRVLSFIYIFTIFGKINETVLKKEMQFKPIMQRKFAAEVSESIIKIILAYSGFGAMSFVYGSLVSSIVYGLSMQLYNKFKFERKKVNFLEVKKILYFAKHSFVSGTGLYLTQQIDKILLTSSFNASIVGLYHFGFSYAQTANNYLLGPQASVMMTFIANNQKNSELPSKLISLMLTLIYIATPLFIVIYINSESLIVTIFTDKWLESVPLFNIFLILGYFAFILFPFASFLTAIGELKINTQIVLARAITLSIVLFSVISFSNSIYTYAWAVVVTVILFDLIKFFVSTTKIDFEYLNLFSGVLQILLFNFSLLILIYIYFGSLNINPIFHLIYLFVSYIILYKYAYLIISYMKK